MFTETPDLIQGLVQEGTGIHADVFKRVNAAYPRDLLSPRSDEAATGEPAVLVKTCKTFEAQASPTRRIGTGDCYRSSARVPAKRRVRGSNPLSSTTQMFDITRFSVSLDIPDISGACTRRVQNKS